jgi:hypothetical protein
MDSRTIRRLQTRLASHQELSSPFVRDVKTTGRLSDKSYRLALFGEEKANILSYDFMSRRRSETKKEDVLSQEELKALHNRLSQEDTAAVESFYRSAHHRCALQPWWLPPPRAIQELVQAWKILRKGRR